MTTTTNPTPLELHVLGTLLLKQAKKLRSSISEGEHTFDPNKTLQFALSGTSLVSADEERADTVSIPFLVVVGLFAKHAGWTREKTQGTLKKALNEALASDKDTRKELLASTGVSEMVESFKKDVIGSLPKKHVRGKITNSAQVSLVQSTQLSEVA